jgi:short-subunit dehydrogenase
MRLDGSTVLITGASTGIGAACAREMAGRGATVALVARSAGPLGDLALEIVNGGGKAHAYPTDVSSAAAVAELADRVAAELGVPDVIINNAGAGRFLFIDETPPDEIERMMAVPFFAAFWVTRAFVQDMIVRGSGRIVNLTTPVAFSTWPGSAGYACARWAMRGLTAALRADLAGTGVGVTEVVPAKVSSEYFANNPGAEDRIPSITKLIGTITPEECARGMADGIERDRRQVLLPLRWRLLEPWTRITPRVSEWLVRRGGATR